MCVIAGAVAYVCVPKSRKKTFYERLTFKQYVETFWWDETRHSKDFKKRELDTQEGIRALLPLRFSNIYLPKDNCKAFYEENRMKWEKEQPYWFDEEFKNRLPEEFLSSLLQT